MKTNKSKTKPVSSWRCQRQAGAVKALQRVVWSLIILGFGVRLVNAEVQGSQVQQRMSEKDLHQTLQVDVPWRKKMLHWRTSEVVKVEGTLGKKGKDKRNSQEEDPRTFKVPVERWRFQKKWKEKKWKKKKRKLFKNSEVQKKQMAKERIASFFEAKWKEEREKRRAERVINTPQDKTSLGQVGKMGIFPHACGAKLAACQRRSRRIAAKDRGDGKVECRRAEEIPQMPKGQDRTKMKKEGSAK